MGMIEDVFIKTGGTSGQLQFTNLTYHHFQKNALNWMNVSLAVQLVLQSTANMSQTAMDNDDIVLNLCKKGMYCHICDLCRHLNYVVDVAMGKEGHTVKIMQSSVRSAF